MSELTIAETLLDEVMTLVRDQGFSRITGIEIAVGEAAPADPDALGRILDDLRAGTPAESAEVRIITEKLRALCRECSETFLVAAEETDCPLCGHAGYDVITGRDVMLVNLVGEKERVRA